MWASVMLFILAVMGALAAAAAAAFFRFRGQTRLALRLILLLVAAGCFYLVVLVVAAALSRPTVIALGGEKHICEIDCHVAYAVLGVEQAETLGSGASQSRANGMFFIITVRTRFDRETISNRRALDIPLTPGRRRIRVLAESGAAYGASAAGQAALGEPAPSYTMLTRSLKPGDEFVTRIVFDLPKTTREPMLLIQDTDFTKWVLIGSETFPLHKKALFRLTPGPGVRDVAA